MANGNAACPRKQVEQAEAAIGAARQAYQAALREAERARDAAQSPFHAALSALQDQHQERALELAIDANSCPRKPWGSYLDPDEVCVQADGLLLIWDINGDYAPATFLAGWEELQTPAPAETC